MSAKGRTTPRRGRDRSARWDSHEGNGFRTRSYPAAPEATTMPETPEVKTATLAGRPGAAERTMSLEWGWDVGMNGMLLSINTTGWYEDGIDLSERQARFLIDTLRAWFPADEPPQESPPPDPR